ncbi:MAG: 30S ribosomal protein S12 methylthiotransferase RimO [Deltaproteobacteria bacterium]|jgi:ribosomal protein S12 methylthiotransferase|nr:30S ribosomal protein S12 methylthiotransferase RimO [Deltaproteobacteria bacterium]
MARIQKPTKPVKPLKIYFVSLGCAKNLVDSERILYVALKGLNLEMAMEPEDADLIVVNTCAFIRPAVEEAIQTILELHIQKKAGAFLAVLGCLPAREGFPKEFREADLVLTRDQYPEFANRVKKLFPNHFPKPIPPEEKDSLISAASSSASLLSDSPNPDLPVWGEPHIIQRFNFDIPFDCWGRAKSTPFFRAYLKISEGCARKCSFCLIPSIRGPLINIPLETLVREARAMVYSGVREITLIAQDLTAYRDGKKDLVDLILNLAEIQGLAWIRLMYAYPGGLTPNKIKVLSKIPQVVPYLDIPVQHASPRILEAMGRGNQSPLPMIAKIKEQWEGVRLRTTLMVGFPGETDEDFAELLDFLRLAEFSQAGFFTFFPEKGTRAAELPEQVLEDVKKKRLKIISRVQSDISLKLNQALVGQTIPVLVEGPSADSSLVMFGRAHFHAPDVDGVVYFDGTQPKSGELVNAKMIQAGPYDLVATLDEEDIFA